MRERLILSAILIVCGALIGLAAADGARRRLQLLGRLTEAVRLLRVRMLERAEPLRSALERTEDTLSYLGAHKRPGQLLCGFAMETSQLEERARGKLERKNLDLIAANNLKVAGAGFGTDTNVITLIDKQQTRHLEQMSKEAAAMEILTVLRDMMK